MRARHRVLRGHPWPLLTYLSPQARANRRLAKDRLSDRLNWLLGHLEREPLPRVAIGAQSLGLIFDLAEEPF